MRETSVPSLGWEDSLEEGMGTHSSIPAWRIRCTEDPGELQSMGLQRVRHNWVTKHTVPQTPGFPGSSVRRTRPLMQETQERHVRPLIWEEALEKETGTHSSLLAWAIPWTEEPGGLQPMESQRVWHNLATKQQQQKIINIYCCFYELVHLPIHFSENKLQPS